MFSILAENPIRMTATNLHEFRTHLGMIREKKGLSQSQLSKYSGLDLTYLQGIESGAIDPELVVLVALANTLEIEVKGMPDI